MSCLCVCFRLTFSPHFSILIHPFCSRHQSGSCYLWVSSSMVLILIGGHLLPPLSLSTASEVIALRSLCEGLFTLNYHTLFDNVPLPVRQKDWVPGNISISLSGACPIVYKMFVYVLLLQCKWGKVPSLSSSIFNCG